MRGYFFPKPEQDLSIKEISNMVACRNCYHRWSESYMGIEPGFRINGPSKYYDYCDKCKDQVHADRKPRTKGDGR